MNSTDSSGKLGKLDSRLSRRGFLGGVAASAAGAILAACGGEEIAATATRAAANPAGAATAVATNVSGAATAVAPTVAATAVRTVASTAGATTAPTAAAMTTGTTAPTAAPTIAATARPANVMSTGTAQALSTGTSGTTGMSGATGQVGVIAPPPEGRFRGQSIQILARTEYFKETEMAQKAEIDGFMSRVGAKAEINRVDVFQATVLQKQVVASMTGNVEDLMYTGVNAAEWKELGVLQDVTDVVTELEAVYGPVEAVAKNNLFIDGKWWGIPYYGGASGYFARKDWLDEKGIKLSEVKTFENLRDVALEISDPAKRRYGWGFSVNRNTDANSIIVDTITAYGGAISSNDGTKVVFNSPETVQAITVLSEIYTNPKYRNMLPPGVETWTNTGNNEAWLAGLIGFCRNAYSLYAQAFGDKNPVYPNTLTFPGIVGPGTDRVVVTGGVQYFVIFKGAKNTELAKATAKHLVGGTPLLNVAKTAVGQALPVYRRLWDSDPYYTTGNQSFPALRAIVQQELPIRGKTGFTYPQAPSPGKDASVNSFLLTDMMGEITQKGQKPADAVKEAHARMVKAFEQLGLKQ